jgi:hypothetical protein
MAFVLIIASFYATSLQEWSAAAPSAAVDAHQILDLCVGERAPSSRVDFFTGAVRA